MKKLLTSMGVAVLALSFALPANAATKYVLYKLVLGSFGNSNRIAFRIQPGRSIILKPIAVKLIRSGLRYQSHLRATAASQLCCKVAGDDLEFLDRVGIGTKRSKV